MRKNKHLSMEERFTIKSMLDQSASFKAIACALGGDCTTISKEVRSHLIFKKTGCFGHPFNDCANRFTCPVPGLCSDSSCRFKNVLSAQNAISTALIILSSTVLTFTSHLTSATAVRTETNAPLKNIFILLPLHSRSMNSPVPNPDPAFAWMRMRPSDWTLLFPLC